jgi:hemerythrin-like domain-containing protein
MTIHERNHTGWPVQLRLPGQSAAPEGPVDMHMMYVMHHAFRRDLAAFAEAAQHTPTDDRATWQALAERWEVFSTCLHHHHAGEDRALWPLLLERGSASDRATLEAMEAEHAEIDPILQACAAGFRSLAERADDDARAALAVRLVAARESLGRHLAHEENDAIAIIQRVLTNDDWQRLDEEEFKKSMPLRQVLALVPWAAHGMPGEARERVLADAGPAFRLAWLLTRGRFARREERAFRYVR